MASARCSGVGAHQIVAKVETWYRGNKNFLGKGRSEIHMITRKEVTTRRENFGTIPIVRRQENPEKTLPHIEEEN